MIRAELKWSGDGVLAEIKAKSWAGVQRAMHFYWLKCLEAVNVSNPLVTRTRTRDTKVGPRGSTYPTWPTPAVPPAPPRKRTGIGQAAIQYELDEAKGEARLGVVANGFYMAALQLRGWDWMLSTLNKNMARIKALAALEK